MYGEHIILEGDTVTTELVSVEDVRLASADFAELELRVLAHLGSANIFRRDRFLTGRCLSSIPLQALPTSKEREYD